MGIQPFQQYDLHKEHEFAKFLDIDRIRLIDGIVREHLNINGLLKHEILIDYFPIHKQEEVAVFRKMFLGTLFCPVVKLDFDEIRAYFGERMMFYFLWMLWYTNSLLIPSFFGIVLYLMDWMFPNSLIFNASEVVFAFILSFWGAYFCI